MICERTGGNNDQNIFTHYSTVTLATIMTVNCVGGGQANPSTGDLESAEFINTFPGKIYSEEDFGHQSVKFNKNIRSQEKTSLNLNQTRRPTSKNSRYHHNPWGQF